jgi:tRNA (guanine9-N1)-methyltransferase
VTEGTNEKLRDEFPPESEVVPTAPEPEPTTGLGPEYTCPVTKTTRRRTIAPKESIVYLTADSNFELEELKPDETYIIGGIVDKNRYKVSKDAMA